MGIVMLLLTLGVDFKTVKQDYLISQRTMVPYVKKKQDYYRQFHVNDNFLRDVKSLYTVSPDYLNSAMTEIKKVYGTWANIEKKYLKLNPRKIKQLKQIYLTNQ